MPRHLAYPLAVTAGRAATVEQDTPPEITGCCHAILRHRIGDRWEDPEFGIPDPTFTAGDGVDAAVLQALGRWEPRATPGVTVDHQELAAFLISVQVEV